MNTANKILKGYIPVLLLLAGLLTGCNNGQTSNVKDQFFATNWKDLTKDFNTWYNYTYYNVVLSDDFIALNTDLQTINKKAFLEKLTKENVVAFKTKIENGQSVYQLFPLHSNNESIKATSQQMASTALAHFNLEGSQVPNFRFTDLVGNVYDNNSTKGKTVVLKCWFIHCVACVKEFPQLNVLVDKYRGRDDVVFISLAIDTKKDLQGFL